MIQIIAECGINHFGDMELARELIRQAKRCGATYAKFQLYDVGKVFPSKEIIARDRNWYEEVKPTQLTKEQAKMLFNYGEEIGMEVLFSVFDTERVEWCEEIGVKRYKIATRMRANDVLRAVFCTTKPIIHSSTNGMPVSHRDCDRKLYCVPNYPTALIDLKFSEVSFDLYDGFSDHTVGIEAAMVAISRGAKIIEEHFCLSRERDGVDIPLSITPDELKQLVDFARKVECIL